MTKIEVGHLDMVQLDQIEVGDRARQEMGNLNEMEASMKERGLISPLAVCIINDKLNPFSYKLLAGERRFLVLQKNKVETIPVRIYPSDISKYEMKAIELAENFFRKDMEYWEYDDLIRETHQLQQELKGIKAPGPDSLGWGMQDTADMANSSKAGVSTAMKRSEAREAFPELFDKCKTQKDASNVLKKLDEAVVKSTIAKKLESSKTSTSFTKIASSYILGNAFERIVDIPDKVMHLVEIDPPYAIGLKEAKKTDGESIYDLSQYNEIPASKFMDGDPDINWGGMNTLLRECYRVMVDNSWLILWFGPEPWFQPMYIALQEAGFSTTRMCGIWTKPSGQSKRPEIHLANSYEMFFYAWKGRPALNKAGRRNNFEYSPVPPQQKTHPTERPLDLMTEIYDTFAFPGSRVLIPFLGSGVGIFSAIDLGMTPVGFDLGKGHRDSFLVKLHSRKLS